jgi:hypothetical protein
MEQFGKQISNIFTSLIEPTNPPSTITKEPEKVNLGINSS